MPSIKLQVRRLVSNNTKPAGARRVDGICRKALKLFSEQGLNLTYRQGTLQADAYIKPDGQYQQLDVKKFVNARGHRIGLELIFMPYNVFLYVEPWGPCDGFAYGNIGLAIVCSSMPYADTTAAHELGHLFGLRDHAGDCLMDGGVNEYFCKPCLRVAHNYDAQRKSRWHMVGAIN